MFSGPQAIALIELPLNAARYERTVERLLVPRRIWKGGWYIATWSPRWRHWESAYRINPSLDWGPFLKYQEKRAWVAIIGARVLYPHRRFRLQPVGAPWLLNFYSDIVCDPDSPERSKWFEKWGGGSPLWRMLGRHAADRR